MHVHSLLFLQFFIIEIMEVISSVFLSAAKYHLESLLQFPLDPSRPRRTRSSLTICSRPSAEEQSLLQSETGVPTNSVEHDSSDFSPQENGAD